MATIHVLATVAHRALRSDRFLARQRPDSRISDVGAMQEGRHRKSLPQGDRWLEACLRRRPSACEFAKLAAVHNRGPGRGKRPFQAMVCVARARFSDSSALCFGWSRSSLLFERAPCHGGHGWRVSLRMSWDGGVHFMTVSVRGVRKSPGTGSLLGEYVFLIQKASSFYSE